MKSYKKIATYVLIALGSLELLNCGKDNRQIEGKINMPQKVEWGLPSECHAGHACGNEPVNGLVRAEDCHASHFCGSDKYTIYLPIGQLPTREDYDRLVKNKVQ